MQSEWAFEFLKEPFDLRPWLNIKMPSFSLPDEEATSLAGFFAMKEGEEYPFEYIAETKKEYIEAKRCNRRATSQRQRGSLSPRTSTAYYAM